MTKDIGHNRLYWIDNLRGLACILVIIIHSSIPKFVNEFITPFFLSVFFLISGYLFKRTTIKTHLKKIANGLIIPYFFAVEVVYLIGWIADKGFTIDVHLINGLAGAFLIGKSLWFISALIVIEIFYTFLQRIPINKIILVIIFASSILFIGKLYTPWSIGQSIFCSSYFILGNFLKIYDDKIKPTKRVIIILAICYLLVYAIWSYFGGIEKATMYNNYYENPLQFLILSFSSTIILFYLFKIYYNKRNDFLFIFGVNSFWIFAFQSAIINIIKGSYLTEATTPWRCIPIILLLAVPSLFASEFLRKYVPQVCGKYKFIK